MSDLNVHSQLDELWSALQRLNPQADASTQLNEILRLGVDGIPMPGGGATLKRWQSLAMVAAHDLSLVKLFEGHTDAQAILAELNEQASPAPSTSGETWGVWAAESPNARVTLTPLTGRAVRLNGTKCWCSGAKIVSHGLLTAWHADGRGPHLVRVAMHQPGAAVSSAAWAAVGMAGSASVDVTFANAEGELVGDVGDYLSRPGFWQGGAGIAACWYGGAVGLGAALHDALAESPPESRGAFRLAALGKIDLALHRTAALLRAAAQWIDDHPLSDASSVALRVRLAAEDCARTVLDEAGGALGATAFCRNARFARAAADLPVFIRQSHGERDFVALAELVIPFGRPSWAL